LARARTHSHGNAPVSQAMGHDLALSSNLKTPGVDGFWTWARLCPGRIYTGAHAAWKRCLRARACRHAWRSSRPCRGVFVV